MIHWTVSGEVNKISYANQNCDVSLVTSYTRVIPKLSHKLFSLHICAQNGLSRFYCLRRNEFAIDVIIAQKGIILKYKRWIFNMFTLSNILLLSHSNGWSIQWLTEKKHQQVENQTILACYSNILLRECPTSSL